MCPKGFIRICFPAPPLEVADRQAVLAAERLENTALLGALMQDGERCATIMRKALRLHYQYDAEKLAQFGVLPHRRKTAKPDATAEPATAEPSR
jgi:hypothetical protein